MTATMKRRLERLEARAKPSQPSREVWLCFKDESGTWRRNKTGDALPSESEREARRIFAVLIGAHEPSREPAA